MVSVEDGGSLSSSDLESVYANVRVTDVSGVFICKDRTHIITNMPTDKKGLSHHLNHPLTIATNSEKLNIFHITLPLICFFAMVYSIRPMPAKRQQRQA